MKSIIAIFSVCVIAAGGAFAYIAYTAKPAAPEGFFPRDFYECAKYFPVIESYPRRCTNKSGMVFTEDIGNAAQLQGEITVSTPRPGDTVSSPLFIRGSALAEWFDETTILVEALSANGTVLGKKLLDAKKAIVAEKNYSFEGSVSFGEPAFGSSGTIVIYKAGSPAEELRIPVRFK